MIKRDFKYFIFLSLLLSIFYISLSSAQIDTLGTFRQDTCINIVQTCGNCTIANITSIIFNPNSTQLVNQVVMTKAGTLFNYTFCKTGALGEYFISGFDDLNGLTRVWNYNLFVTPTGDQLSTSQGIIYLIAIALGIILFGLSLTGALYIPWDNPRDEEGNIVGVSDLKYVKLFLWFIAYVMLIGISWLAYNITYGYLNFNVAANFFNWIYWILISLLFPIIVVGFIFMVVSIANGKKIKEAIDRGLPIR